MGQATHRSRIPFDQCTFIGRPTPSFICGYTPCNYAPPGLACTSQGFRNTNGRFPEVLLAETVVVVSAVVDRWRNGDPMAACFIDHSAGKFLDEVPDVCEAFRDGYGSCVHVYNIRILCCSWRTTNAPYDACPNLTANRAGTVLLSLNRLSLRRHLSFPSSGTPRGLVPWAPPCQLFLRRSSALEPGLSAAVRQPVLSSAVRYPSMLTLAPPHHQESPVQVIFISIQRDASCIRVIPCICLRVCGAPPSVLRQGPSFLATRRSRVRAGMHG